MKTSLSTALPRPPALVLTAEILVFYVQMRGMPFRVPELSSENVATYLFTATPSQTILLPLTLLSSVPAQVS